jgi:hypothetical protein
MLVVSVVDDERTPEWSRKVSWPLESGVEKDRVPREGRLQHVAFNMFL